MTPQQIANRVSHEADARFGEVIERLLSILETGIPNRLVYKWSQTSLLTGLDMFEASELAEKLEAEAQVIVDWIALENPDGEAIDKATDVFYRLSQEAKAKHDTLRNSIPNTFPI